MDGSRLKEFIISLIVVMLLITVFLSCAIGGDQLASELDPTLASAIKASVFVDPVNGPYVGSGTAIATSKKKTLILTAAHVVPRGEAIEVVWYDGHRSAGRIISRDKDLDAALAVVDGPALAVAPIAKQITAGKTWAVGFPNRRGPTTRRVTFDGTFKGKDRINWYFAVEGGKFGGGSSGSGIFRNGFTVAMTTHGDSDDNCCAGRDELAEFVAKSAKDRPKDCPLDLFGVFRSGGRGRSAVEIEPNVRVKQLLPGELIRGVTGRREEPSEPPRETTASRRLDRLEDSIRTLKADLLKDVAQLIAQTLADDRQQREPTRAPDTDIETQVEAVLAEQERVARDKAKLLAELRRRSEQFDRLADQLDSKKAK